MKGNDKGAAFNIIVPMSGRKYPYDPSEVTPAVIPDADWADDAAYPLLPVIIWYSLPASQYVVVREVLLLSVKVRIELPEYNWRLRLPGSRDCLYRDLFKDITKKLEPVAFWKIKLAFSSPKLNF